MVNVQPVFIDATCPICLNTVGKIATLECGHACCCDCLKELEKCSVVHQLPILPQQVTRYDHFQGIGRESIYDTDTVELNGEVYIWVMRSYSFYDWTLYDVATGNIAKILSEPPPPRSNPSSTVHWSRQSKRWWSA